MFRNFIDDQRGHYSGSLAMLAVPIICVFAVGYDHMQFSALKQRLPDAAMSALTPAAREMMRGTTDLRKLEKVTADFLSVNLPEVEPDLISVTLTYPLDAKGKKIMGLNMYATVEYRPVSGFIADFAPARSEGGRPWVASFGKPVATGKKEQPNS